MTHFGLAFVIFCLFDCTSALTCPSSEDRDAEVLIFGGGIAGITAAKSLFENGITDVKIFEARTDNIGGRMRNADFGGVKIELGANWIQGIPDPNKTMSSIHPLWRLANDPACVGSSGRLAGVFTGSKEVWEQNQNGHYVIVPKERVNSVEKDYNNAYDRAENLSVHLQANGEPDISVRKAFEKVGWHPSTALQNITEWLGFDFCFGESPDETSLFTGLVLDDGGLVGSSYFVTDQRGLATLVECIAEGIEPKIQLGAMVNNISWNNECVCANVTTNGHEQTVCGKYGIVTFSIGVLQDWINSKPHKFQPELSRLKQDSINAFKMALYLKIFVNFTQPFWNRNIDYILRTDKCRGRYPFMQPVGIQYPGSPNILTFTVVDSEAKRLSLLNPNKTKEEIMKVLREWYGNNISNATDILVPSWYNDPLYRGMYTNAHLGFTKANQINLGQPEGNLYFSGEGTSISFNGYMHGGYCSGLTTADAILKAEGMSGSRSTLPACPSAGAAERATITAIFLVMHFAVWLIKY